MKWLILALLIPVAVGQQTNEEKRNGDSFKMVEALPGYALQLPSDSASQKPPFYLKCGKMIANVSQCEWYKPPAEPQNQSIKPNSDWQGSMRHDTPYYPTPEPADVPAIHAPEGQWGVRMCAEGEIGPPGLGSCTEPTYTCADKSRILLTAEDGKRWCHKVQP